MEGDEPLDGPNLGPEVRRDIDALIQRPSERPPGLYDELRAAGQLDSTGIFTGDDAREVELARREIRSVETLMGEGEGGFGTVRDVITKLLSSLDRLLPEGLTLTQAVAYLHSNHHSLFAFIQQRADELTRLIPDLDRQLETVQEQAHAGDMGVDVFLGLRTEEQKEALIQVRTNQYQETLTRHIERGLWLAAAAERFDLYRTRWHLPELVETWLEQYRAKRPTSALRYVTSVLHQANRQSLRGAVVQAIIEQPLLDRFAERVEGFPRIRRFPCKTGGRTAQEFLDATQRVHQPVELDSGFTLSIRALAAQFERSQSGLPSQRLQLIAIDPVDLGLDHKADWHAAAQAKERFGLEYCERDDAFLLLIDFADVLPPEVGVQVMTQSAGLYDEISFLRRHQKRLKITYTHYREGAVVFPWRLAPGASYLLFRVPERERTVQSS
ncbi:hypothetical protein HY375_03785 [Candidatus Berkelbacteria bacterium]|nr:hypothetical protein [Candidatus Berkelbacteria bacterium]